MNPDIITFFGVMATLGIVGLSVYAGVGLINVMLVRLRKGTGEDGSAREGELEYLRDRAEQVELLAERVAELETRLDFAERLLPRPDEARLDTPVGSS